VVLLAVALPQGDLMLFDVLLSGRFAGWMRLVA
jgi:hypothetical protein